MHLAILITFALFWAGVAFAIWDIYKNTELTDKFGMVVLIVIIGIVVSGLSVAVATRKSGKSTGGRLSWRAPY